MINDNTTDRFNEQKVTQGEKTNLDFNIADESSTESESEDDSGSEDDSEESNEKLPGEKKKESNTNQKSKRTRKLEKIQARNNKLSQQFQKLMHQRK